MWKSRFPSRNIRGGVIANALKAIWSIIWYTDVLQVNGLLDDMATQVAPVMSPLLLHGLWKYWGIRGGGAGGRKGRHSPTTGSKSQNKLDPKENMIEALKKMNWLNASTIYSFHLRLVSVLLRLIHFIVPNMLFVCYAFPHLENKRAKYMPKWSQSVFYESGTLGKRFCLFSIFCFTIHNQFWKTKNSIESNKSNRTIKSAYVLGSDKEFVVTNAQTYGPGPSVIPLSERAVWPDWAIFEPFVPIFWQK